MVGLSCTFIRLSQNSRSTIASTCMVYTMGFEFDIQGRGYRSLTILAHGPLWFMHGRSGGFPGPCRS